MTTRRLRVLVCVACLLPLDLVVGVALLGTHALGSVLVRLFPKSRIPPMSPPRTDSVTVQILSWDGQHLLEEFLPSVLAGAGRHEVVVVDNGSTDSSVQFLKTQYPGIRVVQLDRNYGFSDGNNRGMKQVATDIVVLLNNDMAVDAHFLAPLLKPFADPAVFAVASRITMADPMKASFETGKTRGRFESGLFYVWHDEVSAEDDKRESVPVFWAGAGACAIDRRKFEMLGGFDLLYHPFYVEDTDLSYQAWKRGWKALLAPASSVTHKHRGTSGPRFGELFVNNTTRRNHYLFVWKNVTDLGMLWEHLRNLPNAHGRAVSQYGAPFEFRAYVRAVVRLPWALRRRLLNVRNYVVGDQDVLGLSQ